ncbi:glycosyltransferase family 39 protein [Candidatus Gottesmanbacteria bacterium]|nr:glycosyltransferase family 39 protein [Candidatus Gottesmanbacteria bacterium]
MRHARTALFILIFTVALILKLHNYAVYPQRGATSDEYTYSFMGVSLLTLGVPISWSNFNVYKNTYDLIIDNLYFPMVFPYFDHPPLNGLLVGSWAILNGERTFASIKLSTIRLVPIALSLVSALFVYLLAKHWYDDRIALWSLLIYTTATTFVINGRVVFAENLLTPILLLSLYLYTIQRVIKARTAIVLGVLSGLSIWTKELGVSVFLTFLFVFVHDRVPRRYLVMLTLTFLLFGVGYLTYGTYFDSQTFFGILAAQSFRPVGPRVLQTLLNTPIIVNKPYFDGWYFFGFLCLFFACFEVARHKLLVVPAAIYFFLLLFSINQEGEMGWYLIPLFPFMAMAAAHSLSESINKKGWLMLVATLFVGLSSIRYLFEPAFGLVPVQFRMLLIVLFAPLVLIGVFGKQHTARLSTVWFYLLIAATALQTYRYVHPA